MADASSLSNSGVSCGDRRLESPASRSRQRLSRSTLVKLAIGLAVLIVLYGSVSWVFSSKLIAQQFPSEEQVDFASFGLPNPEEFTVANGKINLAGWYFDNPANGGCGVVMLHGYTGNKVTVLNTNSLFWDLGCDLVFYDLRGHGLSSKGMHTYGALDKGDQIAVIDWFINRTGLPENKIGLIGWSYGAATSLLTAAERPGLAFVIADASYSSVTDIGTTQAGKMFGTWAKVFVPGALLISRIRGDFNPSDAAPATAIKNVTIPTLLIHSTTDEFTPFEQSVKIFANSDQSHTRLILTQYGAPHAQSYGTDRVAYTGYIDAFLAAYVPGFGTARTTPPEN